MKEQETKEWNQALTYACQMMELSEGLEPTSALKQAASENGIDEEDWPKFIDWAYENL